MNELDRSPPSRSLANIVFGTGHGIAGTVYGTIVVMATLTVGYAAESQPRKLVVLVAATVAVLWFAHLYAHGLSESLTVRRRLTREELAVVARRELGLMLAGVLPIAALVLGAFGFVSESTAIWLAIALCLLTLGVEGFRFSRLERLGPLGTVGAISANLALGGTVVVLKVALAH